MPFAFTMGHYQTFGDTTPRLKNRELTSPESWDALRKGHPFFSISPNREEWLKASRLEIKKDGQDTDLIRRARDIADVLAAQRIQRIFSVGSGGAALEYQLKQLMPELHIVCSDYSTVTVEALKKVFIECDDVIQFDIQKGNWSEVRERYIKEDGLCLIYRIDAGLSDGEWCEIFKRMADSGVARTLIIPTGTLTLLSVYNRKSRELKWRLNGTPIVWSGYIRTKKRFQEQWRDFYTDTELQLGGLKGFLLTRKTGGAMAQS